MSDIIVLPPICREGIVQAGLKETAMKFSMYARLMELLNSDGIEGAAKNAKENG